MRKILVRDKIPLDLDMICTLLGVLLDRKVRTESEILHNMAKRGYNRPWHVLKHMEAMRKVGLLSKERVTGPADFSTQGFTAGGKSLPDGYAFTREWFEAVDDLENQGLAKRVILEDGTIDFQITDAGCDVAEGLESEDD